MNVNNETYLDIERICFSLAKMPSNCAVYMWLATKISWFEWKENHWILRLVKNYSAWQLHISREFNESPIVYQILEVSIEYSNWIQIFCYSMNISTNAKGNVIQLNSIDARVFHELTKIYIMNCRWNGELKRENKQKKLKHVLTPYIFVGTHMKHTCD